MNLKNIFAGKKPNIQTMSDEELAQTVKEAMIDATPENYMEKLDEVGSRLGLSYDELKNIKMSMSQFIDNTKEIYNHINDPNSAIGAVLLMMEKIAKELINIGVEPADFDLPTCSELLFNLNKRYSESLIHDHNFANSWDEADISVKKSLLNGILNRLQNQNATSRDMHEYWMNQKEKDGWKYGPVKDFEKKEHPCMVDYDELSDLVKFKDVMFVTIVDQFLFTAKMNSGILKKTPFIPELSTVIK